MSTLTNKQFVFRADASNIIGAGHVMRCLTLADAISAQGGQCSFICREHKGDLRNYITSRGYTVHTLAFSEAVIPIRNNHPSWLSTTWQQDAQETINVLCALSHQVDGFVVDHYGIDSRWHQLIKTHTSKIIVLDDLADRLFDCDLLIDQVCHRKPEDYALLVPKSTTLLLGGEYAMLRPIFSVLRAQSLAKHQAPHTIKRVLISMGGTDLLNATHTALQILNASTIARDIEIDILLGQQSEYYEHTYNVSDFPFTIRVHHVTTPIHELMLNADIAIGAGGLTAWERCCMGLPTFLITIAQNQHDAAHGLVKHKAAVWLGDVDNIDLNYAAQLFNEYIEQTDQLVTLSKNAAALCDGQGCSRIMAALAKLLP